jgi:hypothetical protein
MTNIDYSQVTATSIAINDTDGTAIDVDGYIIPVIISSADAATLLAAYDQADSGSPTANTAREIARAVLDALKRYTGS